MATGPRITISVISPDKKEVFALEAPPFISTEVENGGMLNEVAIAAFKEAKIDAVITILPLHSMIKYYITQEKTMVITGEYLGLSAEEKESVVAIPLFKAQESYLYYKPKHPQGLEYKGELSIFKGLIYGASEGEETGKFKEAGITVVKGRTLSLFKKLQGGTVDFIRLPEMSGKWFLQNKFAEHQNDFVTTQAGNVKTDISIYFNLNNPDGLKSADGFKNGLRTIVNNGEYAKILDKYIKNSDAVNMQTQNMQKFLK
jgi:polar amino acid transport system substrate-binding protein